MILANRPRLLGPTVLIVACACLLSVKAPAQTVARPIKINPKQVDLLKKEGELLASRVAKAPRGEVNAATLNNEMDNVSRVSLQFLAIADGEDQRGAGPVFFGDIANRYKRAARTAQDLKNDVPPAWREGAVRLLEDNVKAYGVVASTQSLTFDLVVTSTPPSASVAYHREGEAPKPYPDPTRATIKNLIYAVWFVRAELNGQAKEKEHNPWREDNHVVHFDF